jgi:hypothetical protein
MNWKSINSEQSYYTIAKTSHIQQRIIGKKWKGFGQSLIHPPPSSQHNTPCICWGMLWPWPQLCFNIIPTFVCTVQHERQINAVWNDVSWSTFFNGTTLTTSQEISQEILNLLIEWDGERWVYAFNSSFIANQSFILHNNTIFLIYFYN